ncbi:MAG: ribonuclease T2 [Glaciimonas sp.]|nr:ribonuclease T2 [Glaciimonas sp.]
MINRFMATAVIAIATSSAAHAQTYDFLLLAASWQPGFCATHAGKPECSNLKGTYAGSHLALHGLWPNAYNGNHPQYCNVPQRDIDLDKTSAWCSMDKYGVSASTLNNLSTYMPGTASCLDEHEWFKHGSCSTIAPNDYWLDAIGLMNQLGQTQLNNFIASNVGKTVSRAQLQQAFSASFGSAALPALSLKCTKSGTINYLTEVWLNLSSTNFAHFPAASSLILDGNVANTCPTSKITIARP